MVTQWFWSRFDYVSVTSLDYVLVLITFWLRCDYVLGVGYDLVTFWLRVWLRDGYGSAGLRFWWGFVTRVGCVLGDGFGWE